MKKWLLSLFRRTPEPQSTLTDAMREGAARYIQDRDAAAREQFLTERLAELAAAEATREAERSFQSMADDLIEAQAIAGAGPWKVGPAALKRTKELTTSLREAFTGVRENLPLNAGATGDMDLMIQTIDWRRQINFSVLQFSRWGIQQIILICRLYWLKNPIPRRLVDVCAAYVFARGVEVTTGDDAANETLQEFYTDNRKVFGQIALTQSERMKDLDGNLFWCLFPDQVKTGKVKCRLIDATEIDEIVTNPDDADEPWLYLRIWTQSSVSIPDGRTDTQVQHAWYPAMGYTPADEFPTLRDWPVMWQCRVHHRKCGQVGKWQFGCPRIFPMVDWAKEARRYLEACASVAQQLAQIALTFTTKGGQQALAGAKQQMGTTVGPNTPIFDSNPTAVSGSIMAMGTGSKLEAFKTQGAGLDMEKVRQLKLMCCMVKGCSETFLSDVSTGNLATATSLDRPFETTVLSCQEEWREDLIIISKFVLETSAQATSGRLAESWCKGVKLRILECRRKYLPSGRLVYEAYLPSPDTIEIKVNFPDIREGDRAANVAAIVAGLTLGNKGGQIIGIDEKVGVTALYNALDIEGGEAYAEEQYPKGEYEIDRTKEELPAPIQKAVLPPGGQPQIGPDGEPTNPAPPERKDVEEALNRVREALNGSDSRSTERAG